MAAAAEGIMAGNAVPNEPLKKKSKKIDRFFV
jgi:hypothetical protein